MTEVRIKVWGENACFTRPEMKVERVSYDVMTPSAARGIMESILWKPAIEWTIQEIHVLRPIRWESVRRNEVGAKLSFGNISSAMEQGKGFLHLYVEEERQQRAGLFLRDVAYVIHANFSMTNRAGVEDNPAKFKEMFFRRVEKGQCHHMPVFGCREFPAYFGPADESDRPIAETRDLGWMLFDLRFSEEGATPMFFRASMEDGIIRVPPRTSEEIKG